MSDFESAVRAAGKRLHARAGRRRPSIYQGLTGQLLARAMGDDALRDGLFQLVDALPQMRGSRDIAAHLAAYLGGKRWGGWQGRLIDLATRPSLAWSVRLFVRHLAHRFLAEETPLQVAAVLDRLERIPAQASLDAVGEAVLSEAEADSYLARNLNLLAWMARFGRPHLSLKLTGLTPRFDPRTRAAAASGYSRAWRPWWPKPPGCGRP